MIITLTPNPSVDRTLVVNRLKFNEILRTNPAQLDWGGKGFNVSRGLIALGQTNMALGWVGGGAGKMLEDGLNKLGIKTNFVWVDGETRTNTVVQEESNDWYMLVNETGPHIPPGAIDEMIEKAGKFANPGDIWVIAGSLPPGVPEDFYADLIRMLKAKGVRTVFDANSAPFKLGVKEVPWMLYPEAAEAERLVGFEIRNFDTAKRAAMHFLQQGIEYVALMLESGGILLSSKRLMTMVSPIKVPVVRVTGTRGALLAGLVDGFVRERPLEEIARHATAFRAAYISHKDYSAIQREEFLDLIPKIEIRSIPMSY
jgi:1-phosphofructokinase family hexose kinase